MEMTESRKFGAAESGRQKRDTGREPAVVAEKAGERMKLDESWSKRERPVSDCRAWDVVWELPLSDVLLGLW